MADTTSASAAMRWERTSADYEGRRWRGESSGAKTIPNLGTTLFSALEFEEFPFSQSSPLKMRRRKGNERLVTFSLKEVSLSLSFYCEFNLNASFSWKLGAERGERTLK
jgi:hypothetical protein